MRGGLITAVCLMLASPALAAPGMRIWTGRGEVVKAGKKLADVTSVGLLELPNGRYALMSMTKPVVYVWSGYGSLSAQGQEHELHVDTFAAQATPDSPGEKADDHCTVVWKPDARSLQRVDCGAGPTWLNFHGDDRGPELDRHFSEAEAATYGGPPQRRTELKSGQTGR